MTLVGDLQYAGLSRYEAQAYYALLSTGSQTGREVSRLSKVPPTRVFDILKQLEEKGLVQCIKQSPMVWRTIRPEVTLKAFIERKVASYKELEAQLSSGLKSIVQQPEKETYENVNTVSGFEKAFSTMAHYIKSSRKTICIYSVGEAIPTSTETEIARAVNRGVGVKFIATKYDEGNRGILSRWLKDGWTIKSLDGSQEYTFLVIDKSSCMIVVKNPKVKDDRLLIAFDNRDLSAALYEYFGVLWKRAKSVI